MASDDRDAKEKSDKTKTKTRQRETYEGETIKRVGSYMSDET